MDYFWNCTGSILLHPDKIDYTHLAGLITTVGMIFADEGYRMDFYRNNFIVSFNYYFTTARGNVA